MAENEGTPPGSGPKNVVPAPGFDYRLGLLEAWRAEADRRLNLLEAANIVQAAAMTRLEAAVKAGIDQNHVVAAAVQADVRELRTLLDRDVAAVLATTREVVMVCQYTNRLVVDLVARLDAEQKEKRV